MTKREFYVLIEKGEDGYLIADVPELPGCHTQGETKEELLANIEEAIELYLEVRLLTLQTRYGTERSSRQFFLSSAFLGVLRALARSTRILPQRAQRSLRKATRVGERGESVGSDVVSCVEDTGLFFWRGLSHARNKV